ncbi:MAG TPA: S9 family peptidase [Terriglobales bacterium]|nr:S9 family peptidase [Terriglobales bacterium]
MTTILTSGKVPDLSKPPIAKKVPKTDIVHGENRVDDYFWLRNKPDPEVKAYLDAENVYTDIAMAHTTELQQTLYREMVGHIKETDIGVPYPEGNYFYYARTEAGKQYPIFCRKPSLDGTEQIVLDVNQLAEGEKFMSIGAMNVSDDGNLLAYSTDNTGFRQYTLHIKNLTTGEVFPERMLRTGSVAWSSDNRTIFYTVEDEQTKRHFQLYRHVLGTPVEQDVLVYEDADERFNVGVYRTRSREFIILQTGSHTTSESHYVRAANPNGDWTLIAPRVQDQEYDVDHRGDRFYIRVNDTGRNFRLVSAPIGSPSRENWHEVMPHRADVMLTEIDCFQDFYVLVERERGLPQFRIIHFDTRTEMMVEFPEPAYSAQPAQNRVFQTTKYRYSYQSMVTPSSVYDYDVNTRQSELRKQIEVPGYDKSLYRSERLFATAKDGVKVPLSIVYRKGFNRDGSHPMLLNGYGSYGYTYPINFSSNALSLLDRGFSVAIAHIRGGGDLGKPWHDDGRMMNKKNTFTDFIAVAEHLITEKYTSPDKLVISGGSAGGLLMGAVVNMRPDLFKAVVSKVPFVDVINTMLDASLPLTVPEYEEWGNPNEKPAYDYMLSYSPYDQLEPKAYPAMLVKTSFHDSQVMYWEPAKYIAKLRTLKADSNPLLLKTNMAAGHGGASGRYDFLHEIAFDYAFMIWQVEAPEKALST